MVQVYRRPFLEEENPEEIHPGDAVYFNYQQKLQGFIVDVDDEGIVICLFKPRHKLSRDCVAIQKAIGPLDQKTLFMLSMKKNPEARGFWANFVFPWNQLN